MGLISSFRNHPVQTLLAASLLISLLFVGSADARPFIRFGIFVPPCCGYYYPPPVYTYYPPLSNVPPPMPQAPMPSASQPANQGKYPSIACVDGRDQIIYTDNQRQDTRCN